MRVLVETTSRNEILRFFFESGEFSWKFRIFAEIGLFKTFVFIAGKLNTDYKKAISADCLLNRLINDQPINLPYIHSWAIFTSIVWTTSRWQQATSEGDQQFTSWEDPAVHLILTTNNLRKPSGYFTIWPASYTWAKRAMAAANEPTIQTSYVWDCHVSC